ncbi:hypothetical protein ACFVUS_28400 [Nocardia sp. NPDC058058]|uniref:hypothetical protein n=1 Tax=Nocardia sp. NPDC058058 TaxID=3346317 RepID=UPI0036DF8E52
MKLHASYTPLTVDTADAAQSEEMSRFSGAGPRARDRQLCFALKSDREDGLVLCESLGI